MWVYAAAQQVHDLSQANTLTLLHWAVLCISSLLSVIIALGVFIVRKALRVAADKTTDALAKLDRIEDVTTNQAENHLATIEKESVKTNVLLDEIKIGQAEMSGKISTLVEILASKA